MNSKVKYGIITSIIWLLFQTLLFFIGTNYRTSPLISSNVDIVGLILFTIITTIVWFWIGYRVRSKYIEELSLYQKEYIEIDNKCLKKEFTKYFLFKRTRLMGLIFMTAIPWYILSPLRETYQIKDFVILIIFFCLTIISFYFYFKGKKIYKK